MPKRAHPVERVLDAWRSQVYRQLYEHLVRRVPMFEQCDDGFALGYDIWDCTTWDDAGAPPCFRRSDFQAHCWFGWEKGTDDEMRGGA